MQLLKKQWAVVGGAAVIVVVLGLIYFVKTPAPVDTGNIASSTTPTATSTTLLTSVASTTAAVVLPFPINAADTIASWSFNGAYTGNATLTVQANADIVHLQSLLGKGQYDNYDLYIGLGNDYNLLGNGKGAYQNYNRAIAIYQNKGLAFVNLGHLMDELGAYHTAADAYAKAVAVEPGVLEYHIERLNFLTNRFPNDTARITSALADVAKVFGDTPQILTIEAQWLTEQGRYADAIKAWQTVEMLSPGKDMTAINAAIAQLKAKE
ncbi:MAG TPA: hypothetical protein VNF51_02455 [Candidatus Paceibacterota bacterium]|nr:hypothetical protein [Candidatus Paceibacterota bacterium]